MVVGSLAMAQGAMDRSELSWRLQALERAWEAADPEAREGALPRVEAAVQSFFRFDFAAAGGAMDAARAALRGGAPLAGVTVRAENRIAWEGVEGARPIQLPKLHVTLDGEPAEGLQLEVRWEVEGRALEPDPVALDSGEPSVLPWQAAPDGEDKACRIRGVLVGRSAGAVEERAFEFVWAPMFQYNLTSDRFRLEELAPDAEDFGKASVDVLHDVFVDLHAEKVPEVELPFGDWMKEFERRVLALGSGKPWMDSSLTGDHLIGFPGRRRATPARLFVPEGLDPEVPVPLVIALHGAGGSEHMFFEAYGNGKLVELAKERGWIVVSPYHALIVPPDVQGMVAMLSEVLPIDASRVVVVGHSMGSVAGLGATERSPDAVAALVAMGGGRLPKDAAGLAGVPVHVAVGEHDFGRRGGEALHAALEASERAAELELHVVAGAEHLMVVQDGLERAFEFLDQALSGE